MKTLKTLAAQLDVGQKTSVELVRDYLAAARADSGLNAFLWQDEEAILAQAKASDERRAAGRAGQLEGLPIAIKDNLLTKGLPTTAGSRMLEGYIAPYDATVIRKLKAAGAIIIGKTNLDEFAMGSSTENSGYGVTKNPWDDSRVPGGSSGGSAVAVAADLAPAALGTDTGGSIRQPAAFCGVVGLKPTYGAVSRYGAIAMGSSLDQIGPFGRSVNDVRLLLEVMAGADPAHDATAVGLNQPAKTVNDLREITIGVPKEYFGEAMEPGVLTQIEQTIERLRQAGATVIDVSLPHTEQALATYYIIMPAEVSSNLARYDGIRFGLKVKQAGSLLDMYKQARTQGFGPEVRRRILLGTYVLSAGYYDAYYKKAQQVRSLVKADFDRAFEQVDVLLTPTSPTTAFTIGAKADPLSMYLADVNTVPINMAGVPALSLPCGLSNGLPVGLQLIGKPYDDFMLLCIAEKIEQIIGFTEQAKRSETI